MACTRSEDAAAVLLKLGTALKASSAATCKQLTANASRSRCFNSAASAPQSIHRLAHRHVGRRAQRNPGFSWASSGRRYVTSSDSGRIAVVGGGLTGLTTAYYLAKELPASAKITLYEGSDRLGGWIKTDKVEVDVDGKKGVVSFERGPRTLSSLHQSTWRYDDLVLYDVALDLGLNIFTPPDKSRYIYYPDHLVRLPPTLPQLFTEPLFLQSFWAGLYFTFKRYFNARKGNTDISPEDCSIAEFLYEVSGSRTVADNLASAMIHGIYGGDIDKLSARNVLEQFYWWYYLPDSGPENRNMSQAEKRLLDTLGQDPQIRKLALQAKGSLMHFGDGGMETLTTALWDALRGQPNVEIKLNEKVDSIEYLQDTQKVEITSFQHPQSPEQYDKVISTLTSQDLSRATGDDLPTLASTHAVSIMTVNLWYPEPNLKPSGFGYLIPRSVSKQENPDKALGVFFDSDVCAKGPDEPEGTKLFVLMGGHYYDGQEPPSEETAIEQAKALVENHLGIPASKPSFSMAKLAKECIPQHYVGHERQMTALNKELEDKFQGRLAVAGGSYTKIGAMGALRGGYDIAKKTVYAPGWRGTGLEQFASSTLAFTCIPKNMISVRNFK